MRIYSRPISVTSDVHARMSSASSGVPASTIDGPQSELLLDVVSALMVLLKSHAAQTDPSGDARPESES